MGNFNSPGAFRHIAIGEGTRVHDGIVGDNVWSKVLVSSIVQLYHLAKEIMCTLRFSWLLAPCPSIDDCAEAVNVWSHVLIAGFVQALHILKHAFSFKRSIFTTAFGIGIDDSIEASYIWLGFGVDASFDELLHVAQQIFCAFFGVVFSTPCIGINDSVETHRRRSDIIITCLALFFHSSKKFLRPPCRSLLATIRQSANDCVIVEGIGFTLFVSSFVNLDHLVEYAFS
mmetsp:Transcript_7852/g.13016  ORF Transcript_7852/g.13016 Transcript_7852/m.13016 type:complete len:229 (-) Transcript_7852:1112-1798(-)